MKSGKILHYEIVDLHYKDGEIWGHLLNKKLERLQQLTLIAPLSKILEYLEGEQA